jgi:hypothetical protein
MIAWLGGWPGVILWLPLIAVLAEWAALRWRLLAYYRSTMPLGLELRPLGKLPEGEGQSASVDWWVVRPGLVMWKGGGRHRQGLSGLHGVALCEPSRKGVVVEVFWSPPISAFLAGLVLAIYGLLRGVPQTTMPTAVLIVGGTVLVYYLGALRAAGELRFALSEAEDESRSSR